MTDHRDVPESWAFDPDRRARRSLLVGIEPIGLGTPACESLSSYIARLAWHHGLPPSRLVRDVLAPSLGHPTAPDGDPAAWEAELARVTRRPSGSLDGHAPMAATWVGALEQGTGRGGLAGLTLLPWREVLPEGTPPTQAGMVPCVPRDLEAAGRADPRPLLWQFSEVTICPTHQRRLRNACPDLGCRARGGILTAWARGGHCTCGTWLGSLDPDDGPAIDADELDWQAWVAAEVGSLIAATAEQAQPASALHTVDAFHAAWARTGLSLTALARATGMALATLSLWKDGRRQPGLPGVLRLCRVAGIPILVFLRADVAAIEQAARSFKPSGYVAPSRERHVTHDPDALERRLRGAMHADPPPSLASVLAAAGIDRTFARRRFPMECAEIALRHQRWRQDRAQRREDERMRLVRDTFAGVVAEGRYPSRHQVQKRLPSGVSLRSPRLWSLWRELIGTHITGPVPNEAGAHF